MTEKPVVVDGQSVQLVCSNKPRPSVHKTGKGHQHWLREVHHAKHEGMTRTLCNVDASGWLDMGAAPADATANPDLCERCKRVLSGAANQSDPRAGEAVAWRWKYEGNKGWVYTETKPSFFPDEQKLNPIVEPLYAPPVERGALEEARFLVDRLNEYDPEDEDHVRDFHGHVIPPLTRLSRLLDSQPSSTAGRSDNDLTDAEIEAGATAMRLGSTEAELERLQARVAELVNERDYWNGEVGRHRQGLIAIHQAPETATAAALKSVAYDVALNCMDAETAAFQIERRSCQLPVVSDKASLERVFDRLGTRLNNVLCEMKPDHDDSIVGFNEAWDVMRAIFKEELERQYP